MKLDFSTIIIAGGSPIEGMDILSGDIAAVAPPKDEKPPIIEGDETPDELAEDLETLGDEGEESDEDKDLEATEPKDEDLDLVTIRPKLSEITKKYPELFKDFPALRDMYYREVKITEVFPTIEDAKLAKEELEGLTALQENVQSGTVEGTQAVLSSIKELGEENLSNFAINFLPSLKKIDPEAYYSVIAPETVNWVRQLYNAGARLGEEAGKNLRNAALVASLFYFEDQDIATGKKNIKIAEPKLANKDDKGNNEIEQQRTSFLQERHSALMSDITSEYEEKLSNSILQGLDEDGVITPRVREWIVADVIKRIDKVLANDSGHKSQMSALWSKAKNDKYSRNWKDRILSAALSRAKTIMPTIRARARAEALSTKVQQGKKVLDKGKETNSAQRTGSVVKSNGNNMGKIASIDPKKIDYKKTSDMDILNGKVTLKS